MGKIFIGGAYQTEQQVEQFNRELRFNREFAVQRRVDEIKREVLAERKQRERLVRPKRK